MREGRKMNYAELFRDYFNNFLTVEKFAEFYGFPLSFAHQVIRRGRIEHEKGAKQWKEKKGMRLGAKDI
jgi:hypothetical protein